MIAFTGELLLQGSRIWRLIVIGRTHLILRAKRGSLKNIRIGKDLILSQDKKVLLSIF